RLLQLRKALLDLRESGPSWREEFQVLLPCLGHQACGALAEPEDWCHEDVSWWRAPYYRRIDDLAGLDRKSLPFSYLVIARSRRPRSELLPALGPAVDRPEGVRRLVSPSYREGKDLSFYTC